MMLKSYYTIIIDPFKFIFGFSDMAAIVTANEDVFKYSKIGFVIFFFSKKAFDLIVPFEIKEEKNIGKDRDGDWNWRMLSTERKTPTNQSETYFFSELNCFYLFGAFSILNNHIYFFFSLFTWSPWISRNRLINRNK